MTHTNKQKKNGRKKRHMRGIMLSRCHQTIDFGPLKFVIKPLRPMWLCPPHHINNCTISRSTQAVRTFARLATCSVHFIIFFFWLFCEIVLMCRCSTKCRLVEENPTPSPPLGAKPPPENQIPFSLKQSAYFMYIEKKKTKPQTFVCPYVKPLSPCHCTRHESRPSKSTWIRSRFSFTSSYF